MNSGILSRLIISLIGGVEDRRMTHSVLSYFFF